MTFREVIEAAFAKSSRMYPGDIDARAEELLGAVARALGGLFAIAVRVNDRYFASSALVDYDGGAGGWPFPAAAESVYGLELESGAPLWHVPDDDRAAAAPAPSVFEEGRVFKSAGNPDDPGEAVKVRIRFSRLPAAAADLDAPIDPQFPAAYYELLILETAIYLALWDREGRGEELADYKVQRDSWALRYIAHLEHASTSMVRRDGFLRHVPGHSLVSLGLLLAGGSTIGQAAA